MTTTPDFGNVTKIQAYTTAESAYKRICEIYDESARILKDTFKDFAEGKTSETRGKEHAVYPFLGIKISHKDLIKDDSYSYGAITDPGTYGITLTKPILFKNYYMEQLQLLLSNHNVPVYVGLSEAKIPLPFIVEKTEKDIEKQKLWEMKF